MGADNIGRIRKWLSFDGLDDYVELPDKFVQNTDEITVYIEYEFEGDGLPGMHYLFGNGGNDRTLVLGIYSRSVVSGSMQIGFDDTDSIWRSHNFYGCENIRKSQWVVGQYKKGDLRVMIEGAKREWTDLNYDMLQGVPFKYIGAGGVNSYLYKGRIYKVAVWFRYLSDDEIERVKKGEMITDGLHLWLDGDSIDEANGIWRDKSKYHNDGIIYGAEVMKNIGRINGKWLHLNSLSAYVDCGNGVSIQNVKTIITIEKFNSATQKDFSAIISKAVWTGTSTQGWVIRKHVEQMRFEVGNGTNKNSINFDITEEGIYMLAGVIDDAEGKMKAYQNGCPLNSMTLYYSEANTNLVIGRSELNSIASYFRGNVYFVATYNQALNDDEIAKIYNDWKKGMSWSKLRKKYKDDSCVLWLDPEGINEENNKWIDASKYHNDGTIYGATTVKDARPIASENINRIDGWLHFDGVNDNVQVNNTPELMSTKLTVFTLFRLLGNNGTNPNPLANAYASYHGYRFEYSSVIGVFRFIQHMGSSAVYNTGAYIDIGKTYLTTGVIDDYTLKLYINGIKKDEDTYDDMANFDNPAPVLHIGQRYDNNNTFPGNIYFIAIYREVKSDNFIKKIYNDWANGMSWSKLRRKYIDASCVLWLDPESIGDSIWYDMSKHKNNGTIYGANKVSNVGVL